jgi:hypothetical protein
VDNLQKLQKFSALLLTNFSQNFKLAPQVSKRNSKEILKSFKEWDNAGLKFSQNLLIVQTTLTAMGKFSIF